MKKRIISVLLIIALLVAVGIVTAQADPTTVAAEARQMDFSNSANLPTNCPACGATEGIVWQALSANGGNLDPRTTRHYYVDGNDTTLSITNRLTTGPWDGFGGSYCIHLNGNTLTGGSDSSTFYVRTNSTVNIMGDGAIVSYNGATSIFAYADTATAVKIYDGNFSAAEGTTCPVITNKVTVEVYGGTFNSEIVNTTGTLNINGGTISKVSATDATGTVSVSGAPVVDTLDLTNGPLLTVGELTEGASIGIAANGVFTGELDNANAVKDYFNAPAPNEITVGEGGVLQFSAPDWSTLEKKIAAANAMVFSDSANLPTYCPVCGLTSGVQWKLMTKGTDNKVKDPADSSTSLNGHFYLSGNINLSENLTVGKNAAVETMCLHFNGNTITGGSTDNGAVNFRGGDTLNLMGASGGFSTDSTVNVFRNNSGTGTTLNIYGGNYTSTNGTVVAMNNPLTVNVYAGTLNGTVNAVSTGVVNVEGGSVQTINYSVTTATVNLAGKPTVSNLQIASGAKVGVVGLTEGAEITVSGVDGVAFTADDMSAYADCFKAKAPNDIEVGANGQLIFVAADFSNLTPDEQAKLANEMDFSKADDLPGYCPACKQSSGIQWLELTSTSDDAVHTGLYGHYYVKSGFTQGTNNITVGETRGMKLCIHFNGQTITGGGENGAVNFRGDATLNLMGASGGLSTDSTVNVFRNNSGTSTTLNIYGGNYTSTNGTVVAMNYASLTANIYGGTLTGIVNAKNSGTVNVAGGTISNLVVDATGTVNLSGAPIISTLSVPSGKTVGVEGLTEGANIVVSATAGQAITAAGMADYAKYFEGAFPNEVVANTDGALVFQAADWSTLSVDEQIEIANDMDFSGTLPTYCPICKRSSGISWTALPAENSQMNGHYYLADSITVEKNYTTQQNATVCVNLNNKTLTGDNQKDVIANGIFSQRPSTLNLMGEGNVTANDQVTRIFNVQQGCTLKIYGGTYTTSYASDTALVSGAIYSTGINDNCLVEMYGGTVNGAQGEAGVYVRKGTIFKMYGGTINSGSIFIENSVGTNSIATQTAGAEIYDGIVNGGITVQGTNNTEDGAALAVSGGDINIINVDYKSAIALSGDPEIDELNITTVTESEELSATLTVSDFAGTVKLRNPVLVSDGIEIIESPYYGFVLNERCTVNGNITGKIYAIFTGDTNNYGVLPVGESLKIATTSVVNGESETWYLSTADAVTNVGNGYVKLHSGEDVALNGEAITLDLNGQFVKITGTGTITGFDSATKNFTNGGTAIIDEAITVNTPDQQVEDKMTVGYIKLVDADAGTTTFNYYAMRIAGIALNPNKAGLYYKATWSVNDNLKDAGASAGVVVSRVAINADFYSKYEEEESYNNLNPDAKKPYTYWFYGYNTANPEAFTNGAVRTSVLVKGILSGNNSQADNASNADTDIYAKAYIMVGDEIILSEGKNMSILDVLSALDADESLYEANKSGLDLFYTTWKDYLPDNWFDQFNKIGKVA